MNTALLLIDLQKDFFRTEYKDQELAKKVELRLTDNINQLLDSARHHQLPIFFVVTSLQPDGSNWNLRMKDIGSATCIKGTEGEAIIPGLNTNEKDHLITKTRYSAFFNTNLHESLQAKEIDTLIIGGINTHACIRTSAVDAFMRDYRVFIPEECVASYDPKFHDTSMDYFSKRIAMVLPLESLIRKLNEHQLSFEFSE